MANRQPTSDLFWCVCMILATPACVLMALNADWLPANPRNAQAIQFIRYGGWALSAACPVMAVLTWRSWRKSRIKPDPPGVHCPMCGALCATAGRCLTCGELFSAAKPASPAPVQRITQQPGLREYLIVLGVVTLFVVGLVFVLGGAQRAIYCGAIAVALVSVLTFARAYGIPKLISYIRSGRRRDGMPVKRPAPNPDEKSESN